MRMIDTDNNEESFFVRHVYFLGTDPYERLKKALKAEIDPDIRESLDPRPADHCRTWRPRARS